MFDYISITTGTLYQDLCTRTSVIISIISRPVLLRMRNVSQKLWRKSKYFIVSNWKNLTGSMHFTT